MNSLETKIPPPIVTVLFALAMWLGASFGPFFELSNIVSVILIATFSISGVLIAVLGVIEFKKADTTGTPLNPEKASSLVSSGVYRITRNPMYIGSALVLTAWAFYLSSFFVFSGILGFILYINRFQITPEERVLKELFGSEFESYQARVRRWL